MRRCRSSRWTARRTSERAGSNAVEVPHLSTLLCSRISRQTDRLGREPFREHGISYELAKQSKSELFRDLLPLLNSGRVTLPRNDRLVHQIVSLERRVAAGGRETITHSDRGHDDLANACAGAAKLSRYGGYNFWWPMGPDEDGNEDTESRQPFPLMVAGGVTVQ